MNGFNCAVRTILFNGKPAGKEYWYPTYALTVRAEWTQGDLQMVKEMYDIKVAEPDHVTAQHSRGLFHRLAIRNNNANQWWRRRESNPRPKLLNKKNLRAYPVPLVFAAQH